MKRIALPLLLAALVIAAAWYFLFQQDVSIEIQAYATDEEAIAVITPDASKQDLWSAIAHFEGQIDATKTKPRVYSYYAAALSMKALHLPSPLDKQASSVQASSVFTDITETYPEQALSVLFEAITLVRSPEFLQLEDKSHQRLLSAWVKIKTDATDGDLIKINEEALTLLVKFLPVFRETYDKRNRSDLTLADIEHGIVALSEMQLENNE